MHAWILYIRFGSIDASANHPVLGWIDRSNAGAETVPRFDRSINACMDNDMLGSIDASTDNDMLGSIDRCYYGQLICSDDSWIDRPIDATMDD
jgi:xylose isomerase